MTSQSGHDNLSCPVWFLLRLTTFMNVIWVWVKDSLSCDSTRNKLATWQQEYFTTWFPREQSNECTDTFCLQSPHIINVIQLHQLPWSRVYTWRDVDDTWRNNKGKGAARQGSQSQNWIKLEWFEWLHPNIWCSLPMPMEFITIPFSLWTRLQSSRNPELNNSLVQLNAIEVFRGEMMQTPFETNLTYSVWVNKLRLSSIMM